MKMKMPATASVLKSYIPRLTDLECKELSQRILKNGDIEARNKLVEHNLPLVVNIARSFSYCTTNSLDLEDFIHEGRIGLIRAAEKYDYRKGKFSTYATLWIKQFIRRAITDTAEIVRVPVQRKEQWQRIRQEMEKLKKRFGCLPTAEKTANILGLTDKEVETALVEIQSIPTQQTLVYLDVSPGSEIPDYAYDVDPGRHELIIDKSHLTPEQFIQAKEELRLAYQQLEEIHCYLRNCFVSERNIKIFKMRYGLDGSWELKRLESVGKHFSVSRERVRQIIARIIPRLKKFGLNDKESLGKESERIKTLQTLANQLEI